MAKNQFKAFAAGESANVTSQEEWENLPALLTGFQAGKASSAQVNKALRQATFVTTALAQYISDKNSADVLDDGDIASFITMLSSALGKDFQPLSAKLTAFSALSGGENRLAYFTGNDSQEITALTAAARTLIGKATIADMLTYLTAAPLASPTFTGDPKAPTPLAGDNDTSIATTAFVVTALASLTGYLKSANNLSDLANAATARNNLQLGTAAVAAVGTGANQVPDMNSFAQFFVTTSGVKSFPGNFKILYGSFSLAAAASSAVTVTFPEAFATNCTVLIPVPVSAADQQLGISNLTATSGRISKGNADTTARTGLYVAIGY